MFYTRSVDNDDIILKVSSNHHVYRRINTLQATSMAGFSRRTPFAKNINVQDFLFDAQKASTIQLVSIPAAYHPILCEIAETRYNSAVRAPRRASRRACVASCVRIRVASRESRRPQVWYRAVAKTLVIITSGLMITSLSGFTRGPRGAGPRVGPRASRRGAGRGSEGKNI